MVEMIGNKEVIDLTPKEAGFFIVQVIQGRKLGHYIVKAETAEQALNFTKQVLNAPIMGVNYTDFTGYLDATEKETVDNKGTGGDTDGSGVSFTG